MKKLVFLILAMVFIVPIYSQNIKEVEVKGVGAKRDDAIQDALRAAIGKAIGVTVSAESQMENYVLVKDAVTTNTKGYITSYDVIEETPLSETYEVKVKASVSLDPLKADMELLTKQIGGVRFLVMYDKRKVAEDERDMYNYTVERINNYLSHENYRYIEKERFERMQEEAYKIMEETDTSTVSFVQKLGLLSGAEFIILISKIHAESEEGAWGTRSDVQVKIEAKCYDNCTAEGLGTVVLNSGEDRGADDSKLITAGIDKAVKYEFHKLLRAFNSYIGSWVNNGIPYELRFYQVGTFRDFRELRTKIKEDSEFGGQISVTSVYNYTRLNITFKNLPDELAFRMLDYADAIPGFKEKALDVLLFYGRQLSFAPRDVVIPEIEKSKKVMDNN